MHSRGWRLAGVEGWGMAVDGWRVKGWGEGGRGMGGGGGGVFCPAD